MLLDPQHPQIRNTGKNGPGSLWIRIGFWIWPKSKVHLKKSSFANPRCLSRILIFFINVGSRISGPGSKNLFWFQGQKDTGSRIRIRNTELIYTFLRFEKRFNEIKRQKSLFLLLYKFHTLGWGKLRIHVWSIPYFDMVEELLGSRSATLLHCSCWAGGGLLALISLITKSDLHFHIQNLKL